MQPESKTLKMKGVEDDLNLNKREVHRKSTKDLPASLLSPVSNSNSRAAKHFVDNISLSSSSTTSNIHIRDYEDDYIYSDGRRPSFFIDSSQVSLSSDDGEGDAFPNLLELILSERQAEEDAIYNDWDSGLSHSSIELNRDDEDNQSWTNSLTDVPVREIGLDFPHRALHFMECQICLEMSYLRRRVCCDFQICNKCLLMYLTSKVKDGKVQIECANDRCNALMYKEEIRHRLPIEIREKFSRFLIDANKDPYKKTCPSCSVPYQIDSVRLKVSKKKLKHGVEVTCSQCRLVWCFLCQAPFHSNITCKKYRNEDEMVKRWAKEQRFGQINAQKCPKCKIFVQKMDGCDHMKCTQCETNFCYRCGDRYISVKFFGSHWNRFSLFGCKYRLMPEKNGLRRFIRGSHFVGRVLAAIVFAGLGVAAGAVLVVGGMVILPGYGLVRLRRRMWAAKQRKKFYRQKWRMISAAEKLRTPTDKQFAGNLETVVEESETETVEQVPDPQQVQVMVHHTEGEVLVADDNRDCNVIVNKYIGDGSEVTTQLVSTGDNNEVVTAGEGDDNNFVTHSDSKEVCEQVGCTKLVCGVMSSEEEEEIDVTNDIESGYVEGEELSCRKESFEVLDGKSEDEDRDVIDGEEIKQSYPNLTLLQGFPDDKDSEDLGLSSSILKSMKADIDNSDHLPLSDAQSNPSLSKGKNSLCEKIILTTKVLKDNDTKNPVLEKAEVENERKGCFGNIFNVGKRTTGTTPGQNISNEEEVKSSKQKISSVKMNKAATWEKCRRSKVESDSWIKSSIDHPINNCANFPLIVHKSSSSFSSIIGFNFAADETDKKKDEGDCVDFSVLRREIVCGVESEDLGGQNCLRDDSNDDNDDESESLNKFKLQITDAERRQTFPCEDDYVSQVSLVTRL